MTIATVDTPHDAGSPRRAPGYSPSMPTEDDHALRAAVVAATEAHERYARAVRERDVAYEDLGRVFARAVAAGVTQAALARAVGMSTSNVRHVIRGLPR